MSRRTDVDDAGWNAPRRSRRQQPRSGRPPHSLALRITGWVSITVVAVLVVATLGAYVKYRTVWDSIKRVDVAGLIGKQPPKYNNAENILLIGSDTRVGQHGIGGGSDTGCNCSDTLMLLHISPGHHKVTVVSIPRETMVPILACAASDGTAGQQAGPIGDVELINAALSAGGPACTWKTFDDVTGIHVDHFVELDFGGFEKIIDDLGGVNVCLPFSVDDPDSGLHLSAGLHHVLGTQALAFWRTREDLGEGSDTQRIQRDQYLMAALVQGIEHSDLLGSPGKMLDVIRDAADAMTTDTGLDQSAMLQIGESLRGLSTKSVQFVTAPNVAWPQNVNDVEFQQPQADDLFNAIAHDTTLPKATKTATATPVLDTTPSQVKVDVENGSGIEGIAGQAGNDLTSRGFDVVSTGDGPNFDYTNSVIEYAAASDLPAVNTLKAQVPDVQVLKNTTLEPGTVDLIIGSTFSALKSPSSSGSSSKSSVSSLSASDGAITADTNICEDQAAFSGPDN